MLDVVIKVGVALLPEVDPAQDRRWSRVEAYGFAHAWSLDHLAWRAFADSTWHATVPTLAAAALSTSRLTLGTFVASPNFRHPVPFAKELMTLDVMSGGRLLVGVGAGGGGFDAAVLGGQPLSGRERADRFEEFVTLLDLLLRQPSTTWSGDWFSASRRGRSRDRAAAAATPRRRRERSAGHAAGAAHRRRVGHQRGRRTTRRGTGRRGVVDRRGGGRPPIRRHAAADSA